MKRMSLIASGKKGFSRLSGDGLRMAEIEGLLGHRRSLAIRKK
jgi:histidinol dehydrogenase